MARRWSGITGSVRHRTERSGMSAPMPPTTRGRTGPETWAHYLHMVDALDTGLSFGLDADDVEVDVAMFGAEVLETPDPGVLRLVNAWSS